MLVRPSFAPVRILSHPERDLASYAGGMQVEVQVDDVDAEHVRLKRLGVKVGELQDRPWGERNFFFEDPDGYTWSYGQAMQGDR
mgnify:CR=1 FL=1